MDKKELKPCPFECAATERRAWQSAEFYQGKWHNRKYWRTWQVASNSGRKKGNVMEISEEQDIPIGKTERFATYF